MQNHYSLDLLEYEVTKWCSDIKNHPDTVYQSVLFDILRELKPLAVQTISSGCEVDFCSIMKRLSDASGGVLSAEALVIAFFEDLPTPDTGTSQYRFGILRALNLATRRYPALQKRVQRMWMLKKSP
jgi:hypothetical protein